MNVLALRGLDVDNSSGRKVDFSFLSQAKGDL